MRVRPGPSAGPGGMAQLRDWAGTEPVTTFTR